jgi:Fur family peroxide stress response transcriptional regulator
MNNSLSDAKIISAFRSKGFKATSQRIAICRNVLSSSEHPNAHKIYTEVKRTHPTVSLATVYKTLTVLRELNLVQELSLIQGDTRFDPHVEPHLNLICNGCGIVKDIDDNRLNEVINKAVKLARFSPQRQSFVLYGLCDQCKAAKK